MLEQDSFIQLLERVRAGDQPAAAELVRRYEPAIRRYVRGRLTDERLRRTLDSMDICQSVLGGFFVNVALGRFDLESPDQLVKLLATMASNKLTDIARRQRAEKRGGAWQLEQPVDELAIQDNEPSPSRIVSGRELLGRFRSMLTGEELHLFEQRMAGRSWHDLAKELETTPDALRMRWNRVVERAAVALGWDTSGYD